MSQFEDLPISDDDDFDQSASAPTTFFILNFPEEKIDYYGDFYEQSGKFG